MSSHVRSSVRSGKESPTPHRQGLSWSKSSATQKDFYSSLDAKEGRQRGQTPPLSSTPPTHSPPEAALQRGQTSSSSPPLRNSHNHPNHKPPASGSEDPNSYAAQFRSRPTAKVITSMNSGSSKSSHLHHYPYRPAAAARHKTNKTTAKKRTHSSGVGSSVGSSASPSPGSSPLPVTLVMPNPYRQDNESSFYGRTAGRRPPTTTTAASLNGKKGKHVDPSSPTPSPLSHSIEEETPSLRGSGGHDSTLVRVVRTREAPSSASPPSASSSSATERLQRIKTRGSKGSPSASGSPECSPPRTAVAAVGSNESNSVPRSSHGGSFRVIRTKASPNRHDTQLHSSTDATTTDTNTTTEDHPNSSKQGISNNSSESVKRKLFLQAWKEKRQKKAAAALQQQRETPSTATTDASAGGYVIPTSTVPNPTSTNGSGSSSRKQSRQVSSHSFTIVFEEENEEEKEMQKKNENDEKKREKNDDKEVKKTTSITTTTTQDNKENSSPIPPPSPLRPVDLLKFSSQRSTPTHPFASKRRQNSNASFTVIFEEEEKPSGTKKEKDNKEETKRASKDGKTSTSTTTTTAADSNKFCRSHTENVRRTSFMGEKNAKVNNNNNNNNNNNRSSSTTTAEKPVTTSGRERLQKSERAYSSLNSLSKEKQTVRKDEGGSTTETTNPTVAYPFSNQRSAAAFQRYHSAKLLAEKEREEEKQRQNKTETLISTTTTTNIKEERGKRLPSSCATASTTPPLAPTAAPSSVRSNNFLSLSQEVEQRSSTPPRSEATESPETETREQRRSRRSSLAFQRYLSAKEELLQSGRANTNKDKNNEEDEKTTTTPNRSESPALPPRPSSTLPSDRQRGSTAYERYKSSQAELASKEEEEANHHPDNNNNSNSNSNNTNVLPPMPSKTFSRTASISERVTNSSRRISRIGQTPLNSDRNNNNNNNKDSNATEERIITGAEEKDSVNVETTGRSSYRTTPSAGSKASSRRNSLPYPAATPTNTTTDASKAAVPPATTTVSQENSSRRFSTAYERYRSSKAHLKVKEEEEETTTTTQGEEKEKKGPPPLEVSMLSVSPESTLRTANATLVEADIKSSTATGSVTPLLTHPNSRRDSLHSQPPPRMLSASVSALSHPLSVSVSPTKLSEVSVDNINQLDESVSQLLNQYKKNASRRNSVSLPRAGSVGSVVHATEEHEANAVEDVDVESDTEEVADVFFNWVWWEEDPNQLLYPTAPEGTDPNRTTTAPTAVAIPPLDLTNIVMREDATFVAKCRLAAQPSLSRSVLQERKSIMKNILERPPEGEEAAATPPPEPVAKPEEKKTEEEATPPESSEAAPPPPPAFTDDSDALIGGRGEERERKQLERARRVHQLLLICEEQRVRKGIVTEEGKTFAECVEKKQEILVGKS